MFYGLLIWLLSFACGLFNLLFGYGLVVVYLVCFCVVDLCVVDELLLMVVYIYGLLGGLFVCLLFDSGLMCLVVCVGLFGLVFIAL